MRIGAWDEEGYSFTRISSIAVDSEGRIFVAQPQTATVQVYSSSGEYLRALGGRGAGPGEFSMPALLGLRGSELWVTDSAHRRLNLFNSDLEFSSSIAFPNFEVAPGAFVGGAIPLADGNYGLLGTRSYPRGHQLPLPLLRVDSLGSVVDTLLHLPTRNAGIVEIGTTLLTLPLQDHSLVQPDPRGTGIVSVERRAHDTETGPATFTVSRMGVSGSASFRLDIPYEPVPLTTARIDGFIERIQQVLTNFSFSSTDLANAFARFDHLPPATHLALGVDGSTWIAREDLGAGHPRRWEILDEAGTVCGALYLAQEDVVVWADRSDLWVTRSDELDVPFLLKYQLSKPGDLCREGTTAPTTYN